MIIEIFNKEGDSLVLTAAFSMMDAGKEIARYKKVFGHDVSVEFDGESYKPSPRVDVRHIAKNMRTAYVEGRIMGDMDI